MTKIDPYNPLDLESLGQSLLRAIGRADPVPIAQLNKFAGSGVYVLYYMGASDPYTELGQFNTEYGPHAPIYVGRSKDTGARQGENPFEPVNDPLLFERVRDHKKSIHAVESQAGNAYPLRVEDFCVRVLVCLPLWIPLAEAMMLREYRPVWNSSLSGFGIHDPGKGRKDQMRSEWDELHPGRKLAVGRNANPKSVPELVEAARQSCQSVVRSASRLHDLRV